MKVIGEYIATLELAEAEEFRDCGRFLGYCRECRQYGATWSCPPVRDDVTVGWKHLMVVAQAVEPPTVEALHEAADALRLRLLAEEKRVGGLALCGDGACRVCERCTRPSGGMCRHPERVRLSLEAVGYNVSALAERAGLKIDWSEHPRYLSIVMGVLTD